MGGDGWRTARLVDVAQINPDSIGRGWPHTQIHYVDISSVGEGQIQVPPQLLALADAPSRAKRLIRSGDTVLSTVRPNRRSMFFADQPGPDWVVSTGFAVLRPQVQMIAPRFLYACVFSQSFTEYLVSQEKGAAYPAVSPEDIGNAVIPLPPLKEQQAIACILGALDDKIELNRRMNRTLEEMARAIFKSWFVDFDPVHWNSARRLANIPRSEPGKWFIYAIECEGGSHYIGFTDDLHRRFDEHCRGCGADWTKAHPPVRLAYWEPVDSQAEAVAREQKLKSGSGREWLKAEIARNWTPRRPLPAGRQVKPEIAALFPDSFEPSELGEIPKGWSIGTIGELCEKPQYGFTASAREEPIGFKFLRIKDINKLAWINWSTVPFCEIEPSDLEKYRLHIGDILIARMADPGHSAIIEEQVEAVFASYLIRFRLKDNAYTRYTQYWLRSKEYWDLVTSRGAGTTRASLNAHVLSSFQLIVPPKPIASAFGVITNGLRDKILLAVNESVALAALRDTLLPKLISGELRVPDVERIAGRCL